MQITIRIEYIVEFLSLNSEIAMAHYEELAGGARSDLRF